MSKKEKLDNPKKKYAMIRYDYFHGIARDRREAAKKYKCSVKTVSRAINERLVG